MQAFSSLCFLIRFQNALLLQSFFSIYFCWVKVSFTDLCFVSLPFFVHFRWCSVLLKTQVNQCFKAKISYLRSVSLLCFLTISNCFASRAYFFLLLLNSDFDSSFGGFIAIQGLFPESVTSLMDKPYAPCNPLTSLQKLVSFQFQVSRFQPKPRNCLKRFILLKKP